MSKRNPKGAALEQSHFESADVVECFNDIVKPLTQELSKQQRDIAFTARDLSLLIGQLQQFQQECLGAFNRPHNAPVRIPAKLFKVTKKKHLKKDSAIYTILQSAYTFRIRNNWKKWDFSNPSRKQKNADLIQAIRTALIKKKFIKLPKIAIMEPVTEAHRKTVIGMIKRLGATYVENINNATHILHGKLHEYNKSSVEEDWFRTLEKDGPMVLVHWWYFPDSFDSWLPQTQKFTDPEEPPEHNGSWKISVRWLQDTERFNEFMNEEDYEDLEEEEEEEEEVDAENELEAEEEEDEVEQVEEEEEEEEEEDEVEEEDEEEEEEEEEEDEEVETPLVRLAKRKHSVSNVTATPKRPNKKPKAKSLAKQPSSASSSPSSTATASNTDIPTTDAAANTVATTTTTTTTDGPTSTTNATTAADNATISTNPDTTEPQEPIAPPVPVLKEGHQPVVRVRDIEAEKPQIGSRQRKNEFEPYLNGDITNISQFTSVNVEYPMRPNKIRKLDEEKTDDKALNVSNLIKTTPYDYTEMEFPEWFDRSFINENETLGLPEIGNADLPEDKYKEYRNYMIDTYRANPDFYLTVSACKDKLDADLVTLVRIHNFLELNKMINTRPDPRRRIFDPYIDSDPSAQVAPKSQRHFKDIEKADIQYLRNLIYNASQVPPTRSSWDLTIEDPNNPDARKIFHCSNCNVDCSAVSYQSLKAKNYQVCIDCFLEGRFPATFSSGDFLHVEADDTELPLDEAWTTQETLRLLEGVERFDDDWLMISEHVGSRSKEQCITHFLQLPINDEFLTAQLSEKELEDLPFGGLPNPIMTTIAFLSGHVNPGVGSAAAKTALKVLMKSGEGRQEKEVMASTEPMETDQEENQIVTKKENDEQDVVMSDADNLAIKQETEDEKMVTKIPAAVDQGIFSKQVQKEATKLALKSAVENARKLASYEDQEIQHWTRLAVKTMVDKLSIKVKQYEELETSLSNELQELEKQSNLLASSIDALVVQHFPLNTATSTEGAAPTAAATTTEANNATTTTST